MASNPEGAVAVTILTRISDDRWVRDAFGEGECETAKILMYTRWVGISNLRAMNWLVARSGEINLLLQLWALLSNACPGFSRVL